ncbi:hypothetical protein ACS0TY_021859 [Phlomoides rotata]
MLWDARESPYPPKLTLRRVEVVVREINPWKNLITIKARLLIEKKAGSRVERNPSAWGGARNLSASLGADEALEEDGSSDDTYHGDLNNQLAAIKKEMEYMRKKMHECLSDYRPPTGCQFSDEILQDELHSNFKPLNYKYDGTSHPYVHLVALEVPSTTPEVKINALMNALKNGDLFSSLAKKLVQTFNELLKRSEKYVTLKEVKRAKKVETKSSTTEKKKELAPKWSSPDPPRGSASRP